MAGVLQGCLLLTLIVASLGTETTKKATLAPITDTWAVDFPPLDHTSEQLVCNRCQEHGTYCILFSQQQMWQCVEVVSEGQIHFPATENLCTSLDGVWCPHLYKTLGPKVYPSFAPVFSPVPPTPDSSRFMMLCQRCIVDFNAYCIDAQADAVAQSFPAAPGNSVCAAGMGFHECGLWSATHAWCTASFFELQEDPAVARAIAAADAFLLSWNNTVVDHLVGEGATLADLPDTTDVAYKLSSRLRLPPFELEGWRNWSTGVSTTDTSMATLEEVREACLRQCVPATFPTAACLVDKRIFGIPLHCANHTYDLCIDSPGFRHWCPDVLSVTRFHAPPGIDMMPPKSYDAALATRNKTSRVVGSAGEGKWSRYVDHSGSIYELVEDSGGAFMVPYRVGHAGCEAMLVVPVGTGTDFLVFCRSGLVVATEGASPDRIVYGKVTLNGLRTRQHSLLCDRCGPLFGPVHVGLTPAPTSENASTSEHMAMWTVDDYIRLEEDPSDRRVLDYARAGDVVYALRGDNTVAAMWVNMEEASTSPTVVVSSHQRAEPSTVSTPFIGVFATARYLYAYSATDVRRYKAAVRVPPNAAAQPLQENGRMTFFAELRDNGTATDLPPVFSAAPEYAGLETGEPGLEFVKLYVENVTTECEMVYAIVRRPLKKPPSVPHTHTHRYAVVQHLFCSKAPPGTQGNLIVRIPKAKIEASFASSIFEVAGETLVDLYVADRFYHATGLQKVLYVLSDIKLHLFVLTTKGTSVPVEIAHVSSEGEPVSLSVERAFRSGRYQESVYVHLREGVAVYTRYLDTPSAAYKTDQGALNLSPHSFQGATFRSPSLVNFGADTCGNEPFEVPTTLPTGLQPDCFFYPMVRRDSVLHASFDLDTTRNLVLYFSDGRLKLWNSNFQDEESSYKLPDTNGVAAHWVRFSRTHESALASAVCADAVCDRQPGVSRVYAAGLGEVEASFGGRGFDEEPRWAPVPLLNSTPERQAFSARQREVTTDDTHHFVEAWPWRGAAAADRKFSLYATWGTATDGKHQYDDGSLFLFNVGGDGSFDPIPFLVPSAQESEAQYGFRLFDSFDDSIKGEFVGPFLHIFTQTAVTILNLTTPEHPCFLGGWSEWWTYEARAAANDATSPRSAYNTYNTMSLAGGAYAAPHATQPLPHLDLFMPMNVEFLLRDSKLWTAGDEAAQSAFPWNLLAYHGRSRDDKCSQGCDALFLFYYSNMTGVFRREVGEGNPPFRFTSAVRPHMRFHVRDKQGAATLLIHIATSTGIIELDLSELSKALATSTHSGDIPAHPLEPPIRMTNASCGGAGGEGGEHAGMFSYDATRGDILAQGATGMRRCGLYTPQLRGTDAAAGLEVCALFDTHATDYPAEVAAMVASIEARADAGGNDTEGSGGSGADHLLLHAGGGPRDSLSFDLLAWATGSEVSFADAARVLPPAFRPNRGGVGYPPTTVGAFANDSEWTVSLSNVPAVAHALLPTLPAFANLRRSAGGGETPTFAAGQEPVLWMRMVGEEGLSSVAGLVGCPAAATAEGCVAWEDALRNPKDSRCLVVSTGYLMHVFDVVQLNAWFKTPHASSPTCSSGEGAGVTPRVRPVHTMRLPLHLLTTQHHNDPETLRRLKTDVVFREAFSTNDVEFDPLVLYAAPGGSGDGDGQQAHVPPPTAAAADRGVGFGNDSSGPAWHWGEWAPPLTAVGGGPRPPSTPAEAATRRSERFPRERFGLFASWGPGLRDTSSGAEAEAEQPRYYRGPRAPLTPSSMLYVYDVRFPQAGLLSATLPLRNATFFQGAFFAQRSLAILSSRLERSYFRRSDQWGLKACEPPRGARPPLASFDLNIFCLHDPLRPRIVGVSEVRVRERLTLPDLQRYNLSAFSFDAAKEGPAPVFTALQHRPLGVYFAAGVLAVHFRVVLLAEEGPPQGAAPPADASPFLAKAFASPSATEGEQAERREKARGVVVEAVYFYQTSVAYGNRTGLHFNERVNDDNAQAHLQSVGSDPLHFFLFDGEGTRRTNATVNASTSAGAQRRSAELGGRGGALTFRTVPGAWNGWHELYMYVRSAGGEVQKVNVTSVAAGIAVDAGDLNIRRTQPAPPAHAEVADPAEPAVRNESAAVTRGVLSLRAAGATDAVLALTGDGFQTTPFSRYGPSPRVVVLPGATCIEDTNAPPKQTSTPQPSARSHAKGPDSQQGGGELGHKDGGDVGDDQRIIVITAGVSALLGLMLAALGVTYAILMMRRRAAAPVSQTDSDEELVEHVVRLDVIGDMYSPILAQ
eukprot:Rhum_TRINITY_DN11455_c0_g1::Rhum_TRINITY_DN11455_c0_g1_i1::g.44889::m.44889